jgi:chemotaxis signal transduction protein/truncated hemoglobin YjbI
MSWPVEDAAQAAAVTEGLVSIRIGKQAFGVPVLKVQDVIAQAAINLVPLAPREVAGSLNLRGRIVTAVDMRLRLNMEPRRADEGFMSVIVERNGELYALLVDDVGDVLWLPQSQHEPPPVTLSSNWRGLCSGLYRLEGELLLVLDIGEILTLSRQAPAAPAVPAGAAVQPAKPASSLFERLGGAGAVEAAVGIFYRKLLADAHISRFFEGVDMTRQAGRQKAFLGSLMGGPNTYTGQDLRTGHRHLVAQGLADSHFDAVLGHLTATLRELGAAEADIVEAVALAAAARADVLGR